MGSRFVSFQEALNWVESHVDYEKYPGGIRTKRGPTLSRIRELCYLLGDPQKSAPAIHVTGTNGKGSTVRMATSLLITASFSVGTYTSPDLQGIRERICYDNTPISEDEWADVISLIASLEPMLNEDLTRFEILTAAAFTYFADRGVAAQVVEVGLGGTWDATNVIDASVSVVTNIGFDHVEILGDTLEKIASEKAGILKENSVAIIGRVNQEVYDIFEKRSREVSCEAILREGEDFGLLQERQAVGGRLATIWTPRGIIEDIYI
ncbi:MAG: dihydrofolate synthase, partial [Acidimicrobiales bacterium]|nr:dihydrofolate synthase [Acidimicrobiales bacterium]